MPDQLPRASFFTPITPGNVIAVVVAAAGLAVTWGQFKTRVDTVEYSIAQHDKEIAANAAQIRENENNLIRQDERTSSILTGIARIEGQLGAIEKRLSNDTD